MANNWSGTVVGASPWADAERARRQQEEMLRQMQSAYANAGWPQAQGSLANALGLNSTPQEPEPNPVLLLL